MSSVKKNGNNLVNLNNTNLKPFWHSTNLHETRILFESKLATLQNRLVYVAPSRFELETRRKKSTKLTLGRQKTIKPTNQNLGLFANRHFDRNEDITYIGGEYLDLKLVNQDLSILKQLNASSYICETNSRKLIESGTWANLMDRNRIVTINDGISCREYYEDYDGLPLTLVTQFQDAKEYEQHRFFLMNSGVGHFINSTKVYIPEFKEWMRQLDRRNLPQTTRLEILQKLEVHGINTFMSIQYQPELLEMGFTDDLKMAEVVVFKALRNIRQGEELISYYNCENADQHARFFISKNNNSNNPPCAYSMSSEEEESDVE